VEDLRRIRALQRKGVYPMEWRATDVGELGVVRDSEGTSSTGAGKEIDIIEESESD